MITAELAQYIHDQGYGVWDPTGPNGNIFVENMPDTADNAIALISSGGSPPDVGGLVSRPTIQVLVRGNRSADETFTLAAAILAQLHGHHDTRLVVGGTRIMLCRARQSEPIFLGRDANGRFDYSINFQLITGGD